MAPPAFIQYYVSFVAYFADEAEYNFAYSIFGGTSNAQVTPAEVAATFGFVDGVNYATGGAMHPERGMYGVSIFGIPTWPGPGASPGSNYIGTVKSDVLHNICPQLPAMGTTFPPARFTWSVAIQRVGGVGTVDNPDAAPVPRRRWIAGFEMQATAEGGQTGISGFRSRDSSRTMDGVGLGFRNPNNQNYSRTLDEYGAAADNSQSWERFYIRVRTLGTFNNIELWDSGGAPSGSAGAVLKMTTTGAFTLFNRTAFSVETLLFTSANILNDFQWHRVDIIVKYNNAAVGGSGRVRLFVDGILLSDNTINPASGGLGANNQRHADSQLGCVNAGTAWEWDMDDWHNAEVPNILGVESLTSIDWLIGTHVENLKVNSGTQVNWSGPLQCCNQMATTPVFTATPQSLVSTTALAQIVGLTDANPIYEGRPTGLYFSQAAAMVMSWTNIASGAVGGRLGYSIDGGAGVFLSPTVEAPGGRYNDWLYPGTGTEILPTPFTTFTAIYEKANNAVSTNLHGLQAQIQYIGVWGFEDSSEVDPTLPRSEILHNCFWPLIAQAFLGPTSYGPTAIKSGTYVGNGTQQTISAPLPFHFLWIRNVTTPTNGTLQWYASSLSGHLNYAGKSASEAIQRVDYNPVTGVTSFTIAGTNAAYNAAGQTYAYIMFCDPGMVYSMAGAFQHASALASANNPLLNSGYQANGGFFIFDRFDNDAVLRLIYKGPGDVGAAAKDLNGVNVASAANFNVGVLQSLSGTHNPAGNQTAYILFRNANTCEFTMCQMFSYTGNGAGGTRVINATPTSGRFPCWVYVQPANAQAWFKDPSDIGTSSRNSSNGTNNTAITAVGVDTITVGTTLNANGIVYNVFMFPGDSAGFNHGTFQPGDCSGWIDFPEPEVPPPGVNVLGNGGLVLNGQVPLTLLVDVSGIYTIVPGKTNDTLYDRQTGQPSVDMAIPNPRWKTGYIGG